MRSVGVVAGFPGVVVDTIVQTTWRAYRTAGRRHDHQHDIVCVNVFDDFDLRRGVTKINAADKVGVLTGVKAAANTDL